ncbi:MAG: phosphoadenylyl-sulfate reductase [Verrucomicrobiota bacterium]
MQTTPSIPDTPAGQHPGKLTARDVAELDQRFGGQLTEEILAWAWARFGPRAAIGTSFQGSGLVMMHLAKKAGLGFPIFTLDTGLLFAETLELKRRLEDFYGWKIESLVPDLTVEQQGEAHGAELWKRDPDLCCTMRKVLPLQSKLRELDCWLTGLRRHQSQSRARIGVIELYGLDGQTGAEIVKLNPMANWSGEAIWQYIRQHHIPYNPLHDRGYRSIGCMTCTSHTGRGEDERAGRWTGFKKVECGIHTFMSRKVDFQI